MAVFDDGEPWERKLLLFPHRINWRDGMPTPIRRKPLAVALEPGEPLQAECQHFLDCVEIGATPRTDGREGLRVLSVLDARVGAPAQAGRRARSRLPQARQSAAARFPRARIHESAYVDDGVEIGDNTSIWHFSHILGSVKIGPDCVIGQNVVIGPNVAIGKHCKIQNNVSIYKGVTLEDGVFCGPSCVFTNVNNPRAEIERKSEFRPTLVKRGATIGANATIVCGHVLGEYSFIAAGSVVTRDVPAFALMAGVPARRIGWMGRHGEKLGPDLVCPGDRPALPRNRARPTGGDRRIMNKPMMHKPLAFIDLAKQRARLGDNVERRSSACSHTATTLWGRRCASWRSRCPAFAEPSTRSPVPTAPTRSASS